LHARNKLSTRLVTLLSVLALLAASLVGVATTASVAAAAAKRPVTPAAVKPDNRVAVPRAMADMALARREHRKVDVAVDQTAYSRTVANPNGTLTTTVSQRPRWVKRGTSWLAASADLARDASGTFSPKAALAGLQLSGGGTRTLATLKSGPHTMALTWPSALPAPSVSGAQATYANVFPGVDLLVTAQVSGGFAETLVVHSASAAHDLQLSHLALGVSLSKGLSQKAGKDGAVTVQTAKGQKVFSSPAPSAWDSARENGSNAISTVAGPARGAHAAAVSTSYRAGSVTMSIPRALLAAKSTVYPVYVDPSYSQTQEYVVYGELQSEYPTTVETDSTYDGNVAVGYDGGGADRGNYQFGLPQLPAYPTVLPVTVSSATMTGEVVKTFVSSSQSHTVNAYYTSETDYSTSPSWNNPPSQLAGPVAATFSTASTAPNTNVSWNVTSWVQTALNNDDWQLSTELINSNESGTPQFVEFSANPTLTYTYSQAAPSVPVGTGPENNATQLSFPISDKVSLKVNVGSGNALVTTSDISLPERGSSLTLGVAYNSLLADSQVDVTSDGTGWRQRQGVDVRLYLGSDGSLTYVGQDGVAGKFTASGSSYTSPPVFHATLANSSGSTCGGTGYTLTWHDSGQVMCFNANGLLTSQADRNGNTTAYSYNSSGQETQIAYTPKGASSPAETVTAAYVDGWYLSSLSQTGGSLGTRTATYTLNSNGDLTSVKQADGALIQFGYDSYDDLTSIDNGAGVTTKLTYNSSRQVTAVSQPYGSSGATATTRLSYVSSTETQTAAPNTNQSQAVSAVPNTTYTLNSQDLVTKSVDPLGDTRSTTYTSFNDVKTSTNALGGVTTNTYTSNSGESLNKSQAPTGSATQLAYGNANSGTNPTAAFQPSSSTDAQNHTTAYSYDGAGDLLQSADALPATAKVTYNSDGSPATSTDPKNGSNSTTYTYNSLHQLTKITPVTGTSLQAETITYDGFGRVATVTDGDSNVVTYTYDLADRVTKEAYTGGSRTLTVTYAYDAAGNLKTQTDASGTTAWTYDPRNMVLTKKAASGGGTLSYSYDADGNLIKSTDAGGATTYTYDSRDLTSSLTDEAGDLWQFAYNADGLRTSTWFDTNSGNTTWAEQQATAYDNADRITRIKVNRASSSSNVVSEVSYCYSAYVSGQSCPTASATTDRALLQYSVNNQTSTTSQYTYDAGNRLTGATNYNGTNYSYTYDSDGNVLTGTNKGTETYNAANQSTVSGYTYDGAGNLTVTPANGTLTYNDAEQFVGASNAGSNGPESLTYAGAGQNEVLSDGSATGMTYGLADQNGQPWIQSYTPTGSAADYVIRDQRGTPLGYVQSGTGYAFGTDNVGSVTSVTCSSGTQVATYTYDPYGHQSSATGTDAAQNLIRYTGALTDTYSTYVHLGARWLNPTTAFFNSQDSNSYMDNPSDGNRYAYASDSPVNYTDPTGMFSLTSFLLGAAVGYLTSTICYGLSAALTPETGGGSLALAAACGTISSAVTSGITG
jgi:RHS repeat-associated protein